MVPSKKVLPAEKPRAAHGGDLNGVRTNNRRQRNNHHPKPHAGRSL